MCSLQRISSIPVLVLILGFISTLQFSHVEAQLHTFDNETFNAILEVDELEAESPFTELKGSIIQGISGATSAVSSGLIIFMIQKSNIGLSKTYHGLMFGMSIMDIMESLMMAITTLPMPKDMVYKQFAGVSIGNNFTCQAQGAIVNGAGIGSFAYSSALCVYYLCAIGFRMKQKNIRKYVEPFLHIWSIGAAVALACVGLVGKFYNPMPYQSWCSVATFPYWCTGEGGVGSGVVTGENGSRTEFNECSMNSLSVQDFQAKVAVFVLSINVIIWLVIFLSMGTVIFKVYRQEWLLKKFTTIDLKKVKRRKVRRRTHSQEDVLLQESQKNHKESKVVLVQSLAYIIACLTIQIFPIINFNVSKNNEIYANYTYSIVYMAIYPLQGLFNLMIFTSQKMYNLKRADEDMTLFESFKQAFISPEEHIVIISRISLVSDRNAPDGLNFMDYDREETNDEEAKEEEGISYEESKEQDNFSNQADISAELSTNEYSKSELFVDDSAISGQPSSFGSSFSRSTYA